MGVLKSQLLARRSYTSTLSTAAASQLLSIPPHTYSCPEEERSQSWEETERRGEEGGEKRSQGLDRRRGEEGGGEKESGV